MDFFIRLFDLIVTHVITLIVGFVIFISITALITERKK